MTVEISKTSSVLLRVNNIRTERTMYRNTVDSVGKLWGRAGPRDVILDVGVLPTAPAQSFLRRPPEVVLARDIALFGLRHRVVSNDTKDMSFVLVGDEWGWKVGSRYLIRNDVDTPARACAMIPPFALLRGSFNIQHQAERA
jgi:hypothetical protein